MDYVTLLLLLSLVWTCINLITSPLFCRGPAGKLPPGPYPFPVIGNIFHLGTLPHQSLAALSKTYGPLMSLKLGRITTIVLSSPAMAKEVFRGHDLVLSSRTIPAAAGVHDHDRNSMAWLLVGSKWRSLRKISKEQIFASQPLDDTHGLRQQKVQELLEHIRHCGAAGQEVDIGKTAFTTALNLMSNTLFSVDLAHHNSNSSQEFKEVASALMECIGQPNFADYFPVLKPIDPQGIKRRAHKYFAIFLAIFDDMISRRLQSGNLMASNDVLGALLDLNRKNEAELNRETIIHLLLDLFVAGIDTTSSTIEWAMTELLHKPIKMTKARSELERVIGKEKIVLESDISRLPYLQAVVKETLRLHPPAPFLVPRKANANIEINGYMVPKGAQILVNVWAIGRDPSIWLNPEQFEPERFLGQEIEFRGQDFELIPFGAGRRICPGLPLANRMVHLLLASLVHEFGWRLEEGIEPKQIDMGERFGITLQKVIPLKAIPVEL